MILLVIVLRYVILASIGFVIYYVLFRKRWQFRKIQSRFPAFTDYQREILYSLITAFIFTAVGFLVFATSFARFTLVYYTISDYGTTYLVISVILILVVHDTYFYWMHRFMHHPKVYRWMHRVHHLSTNPSPWAAMAFHPTEAVVEALIIVIVAFIFPLHPLAIGLFLLVMMIYNVYGHLGYELYPKGFSKSWIGRWINTSVNHNMHHQNVKGNYGLYFLFWDRWMGTLQHNYDSQFDEVKTRQRQA